MAQELDPADLLCDMGDERPAVAVAGDAGGGSSFDRWTVLCPPCLDEQRCWNLDPFVFFRFRDDPAAPADVPNDTADHAADDPALK